MQGTSISKPLIWIVEDDSSCRFIYEEILGYRYQLKLIGSLAELDQLIALKTRPDLMLADLRLPDGSFVKLLGDKEKSQAIQCPFIVVSSIDDLDILKFCFEEGAGDYLTKPFGKAELLFKVEKSLEKSGQATIKQIPLLTIDPIEHTVRNQDGQQVQLTTKEFKIVALLWEDPGKSVHRKQLMKSLWKDVSVTSKTLDVHIFNLRCKLSQIGINIEFCPPQSFCLKV